MKSLQALPDFSSPNGAVAMPTRTPPAEPNRDSERTTLLATYPSRRDAEVARNRLEAHDISSFVTADDAGGMHVEMQLTNGVKLLVLEGDAREAHEILQDANMLSDAAPNPTDWDPDEIEERGNAGTALLGFGLGVLALGTYATVDALIPVEAGLFLIAAGAVTAVVGWVKRRGRSTATQ
jgi:hypothetical protein